MDVLSRLIPPISHIVIPIIPIVNLLTKSHDPPSRSRFQGQLKEFQVARK